MKERGWALPDWGDKQITSQFNSFLQTCLRLFTATWPKRKQVNLRKNDWGILVLVVLDARLWAGFHHAVHSSGIMSRGFSSLPPALSTFSLNWTLWLAVSCKHIPAAYMRIKIPLLIFTWSNSWFSYIALPQMREVYCWECISIFSERCQIYSLVHRSREPRGDFLVSKELKGVRAKRKCVTEKRRNSWAGC